PELRQLAEEQLAVGERLLVEPGLERCCAEPERALDLLVRRERLVELDERDRHVEADARMVPRGDGLAVAGQRLGVEVLPEEGVPGIQKSQRLGLLLRRDTYGPRCVDGRVLGT